MGHRLSKIYTRTGDKGTTGIGGGTRVDKDDIRIEAVGTVDELNSVVGTVMAYDIPEDIYLLLLEIQHDLFDLGSELVMPDRKIITAERTTWLEETLDRYNEALPWLKEFILPSGGKATAHCHLARTVCRRAERRTFTLSKRDEINQPVLAYLNRLSDLFFVIARVLARHENGAEVLWHPARFKTEQES
ncbi:MAG: cob(I)yrinic acid a,c-diamide adenosyltransferase [Gammaproteobacteria bacterium]|nr:cob(I)yrinic acid a,c-diamide adenosyltransferase [Gammaproteobacteria bacterium]MDH5651458.1 cob(I)yrinic acid a,c-diamide adenosyltransferase [Gammaproteobacteria bacterium]